MQSPNHRAQRRTLLAKGTIALLGALCAFAAHDAVAQSTDSVWANVVTRGTTGYQARMEDGAEAESARDWTAAVNFYAEAIDLRPEAGEARALHARALYKSGRYSEVLSSSEDWLQAHPRDQYAAAVRFFRAFAMVREGDIDAARIELESASRFRADLADSHYYYSNLGELYAASGEPERAILFFQQALLSSPSFTDARIGLAAAMEDAGRSEEARMQMIRLLMDQPELSFESDDGIFYVPTGREELYRALSYEARGRESEARQALDRYEVSDAGQLLGASTIPTMRDRLGTDAADAVEFSLSGCTPTHIALSPDQSRIAVVCESYNVWEGLYQGADTQLETIQDELENLSSGYNGTYVVADMAYTADSSELRFVYTTNNFEAYDTTTGTSTGLETFSTVDTRPTAFMSPDRVLLVSYYSSSFQFLDWGDTSGSVSLQHLNSSVSYVDQARAAEAEDRLFIYDSAAIRAFDGPTWSESGSLDRYLQRSGAWDISPSGRRLVIPNDTTLIVFNAASMSPAQILNLGPNPSGYTDPYYTEASTVRFMDDSTIVAGRSNTVYVFETAD